MRRIALRVAAAVFGLALAPLAQGAGLLAPSDLTLPPLRVTSHSVDATVRDQIALTTVQQTFRNDTNRRLEATYVFPLPENAELTNFEMSFNGKMVEGKVLPAEEAARIYESIVRQSKDPGLIEFIGRRLLQMRVFPIEPNSDTRIQVKYQQICRPISGMSGYHYPLRTAKTATTAGGGGESYGSVRFNVSLHTSAPLKNLWSPTHSVEIVRDGEHNAKVAYEASRGSLEEDFLLLYDTDASDLGLAVIAYKPQESRPGHFVLTLTPKQLWEEQEYQPQDVVFVIDTSGSMAGEKIEQARRSLKFCIDKLDDRDRFSVVRFSTGFDVLFDSLAAAEKDKRAEARAWIDKFTAAGGTNINDALKAALDLRSKREVANGSGRPFVMVFITDGQGNEPAETTMKIVKQHPASDGARIFPFGVGHDVNTVLLDQLATAHSGQPSYVQPGENLELALSDFFSIISQPVLTNLKLSLPDIGTMDKFPAMLGDLYHGQQLIVAAKFDRPAKGDVKLTATRGGREIEYAWRGIAFTHTAEADYVPPIWAGRKIAYLIDQIRLHGETSELVGEVVALGQEFGIQTPYTSWLVNPEGSPIARRPMPPIPLEFWRDRGTGAGLRGVPGAASPAQRRVLQSAGAPEIDLHGGMNPAGQLGADLLLLEEALDETSGEAATFLAKRNAQLRDMRGKDGARVEQWQLLTRKIGDRWYNRIGRYLVDEGIDESTEITPIRFGSDAYFLLVRQRPDLRAALAASPVIAVKLTGSQAVLVSQTSGIEEFSESHLEQFGLAER